MSHKNPFIYGNPVAPDQLIGRKKELRQITGRILTGQSTIITGSPRSGKTSIIEYLVAPEKPEKLYGDEAEKLIFSRWDACTCTSEFTLAQFWQRVLKPLEEYFIDETEQLAKAYLNCQENNFEDYELEKLIDEIKEIDKRLVLIIDEFDLLLNSSLALHSTEFFGGLRTKFSRPNSSMVLIITANISRSRLNQEMQKFSRTTSPYFNFMEEVVLGILSNPEMDRLLEKGNAYFSNNERKFIKNIAGGHPYLLQAAASKLWDIYHGENCDEKPIKRQQRVQQFVKKLAGYPLQEESEEIINDDGMLENLSMPIFIIFMFLGTIFGERIGYILTNEDFWMLPIFVGAEPFSIYLFKFGCAFLGAFLGYEVAKLLKNKDKINV